MNILNIKSFLQIVRYQSISEAAKAMYTSQPTVSARLSQLEEELGFPLLLRRKGQRAVELTEAGRAFIPLAEHWLALEEETALFRKSGSQKLLRIAAPGGIQEYVLPGVVKRLMALPDRPQIQLKTAGSSQVYSLVGSREVDAGLSFRTIHQNNTVAYRVFTDSFVLLCPADTTLPEEKIHPDQLDPRYEVSITSWTGERRRWHDRFWDPHQFPWLQVDNNHMVHNYLTDPRCWAVCPTSVAELLCRSNSERLTTRELAVPTPSHDFYLVVLRTFVSEQPQRFRELLDCLLAHARETPWLTVSYSE